MQHTLKYLSQSQIELEVSLTAEEMEQFWQAARKKVLSEVRLDGFRQGNIPEELIKNTDLEEKIFDEAANQGFKKSLKEVIDELDLELIGAPEVNIKKIAPKEEFVYVVRSAILPKPELKNYKEISQKVFKGKKDVKVEKNEIQEAIEWLQKSRAKIVPVDRPTQPKDVVEIEIKCLENEKEIADFPKVDRFILGEGRWPGDFEKQLEGMKVGEEKEFNVVVPADYHNENLRNKNLFFHVKLNGVFERQEPELTDEWAKTLGQFNDLNDLKKSIEEGILEEKETKEKERLRVALLEKLIEQTKIELPEILIEGETENQLHSLKHLIERQGMSFEDYLNKIKKTEDDLKKDLCKEAEKTLKGFVVLRTIAKLENCLPSPEEIEKTVNEIINYQAMEGNDVNQIDREALMEYTKEKLTNEKVFQFLENQDQK